MNVLFLPQNIASMPAITATAINKIPGMTAKFLILSSHHYQENNENVIQLPLIKSKRKPLRWLYSKVNFEMTVRKWIKWADVVHYTWTPIFRDNRDLKFAKKWRKKIFVEWVGSEIRNPEYLSNINIYYKNAFSNGYEYAAAESSEQSNKTQCLFAKYNAFPVVCAEMSMYLNESLFPKYYLLYQRINVGEIFPMYPSATNPRPLIVHSPSAKIAKGSNIIISVIEKLKKRYEFDFVLVHNMKRQEVLKVIASADIFLDQIILGGYGMAAMEAMAAGKPVVCFLLPQLFEKGLSKECPIVNANPDNLEQQLEILVRDAQLRNNIGKQSRDFVEKFHDADKAAIQLKKIYQEL